MSSFLGRSDLPRGLRNNNLGNLRITSIGWSGKVPVSKNTDGSFEQFVSLPYGIRALYKDLLNDFAKDGKNTIRKLISVYAPAHENNTEAYIKSVSLKTGVPADKVLSVLNKNILIQLAKAIVDVENFGGANKKFASLVKSSYYEDAFNLLSEDQKKKLTSV